MIKKTTEHEFWVSNISDKNVCVADLALTIPARRHVNLLDSKHYHYTKEQLETSAKSGSLYKKSRLLKVRQVAPPEPIKSGIHLSTMPIAAYRQIIRSNVVVEEPKYEELQVSEESFADEMSKED